MLEYPLRQENLMYLPLWHILYPFNFVSKFHLLYDSLNQSEPVLNLKDSVRDPCPEGLHELRQLFLVI
jgi:hypothetical protein